MVDRARRKARPKHGAGLNKVDLEEVEICSDAESTKVLAIHEALERLSNEAPQKAKLVKLRYLRACRSRRPLLQWESLGPLPPATGRLPKHSCTARLSLARESSRWSLRPFDLR